MKYETTAHQRQSDIDAFTYHAPHTDQAERYESNRKAALGLVAMLRQNCPPSPELEMAVFRVREAVKWGEAAIGVGESGHATPPAPCAPEV